MISIFAKEAFLNTNPHEPFRLRTKPVRAGHLQRVSSIIRGDQVADEIGAKYNPESGYENDVCIYVKPYVKKGDDFKFEGRKAYIDIIDGHNLAHLAHKHPEVGVITCSEADYNLMKGELPRNEVVLIPQHHCNFENITRTRKEISRVGVIGTKNAFPFLPDGIKEELSNRNIELVEFSEFFTRQDIIDFYMSIDVQIVWRPYKKILSNPLKLVNAASFGIPTIALDESAFWELGNTYIPVDDLEGFLKSLDDLRNNPSLYEHYSNQLIGIAKNYHISAIGERYKELDR